MEGRLERRREGRWRLGRRDLRRTRRTLFASWETLKMHESEWKRDGRGDHHVRIVRTICADLLNGQGSGTVYD